MERDCCLIYHVYICTLNVYPEQVHNIMEHTFIMAFKWKRSDYYYYYRNSKFYGLVNIPSSRQVCFYAFLTLCLILSL